MAGQPWLNYQTPSASGPWNKYQSIPEKPPEPSLADTVLGKAKEFANATADDLPMIGGMVGGVLGAPAAGPAGAIGGAALGGAIGKAGQNLYNTYLRPDQAPKEASDYLTQPVQEGALQGAFQGVGEALPVGARAIGKTDAGQAIGSGLNRVGRFIADKSKSALGSLGQLATGVDKDALLRQFERPAQTAAMQGDQAIYDLGQKGLKDVEATGNQLGQNVGRARDDLIGAQGTIPVGKQEIHDIVSSGKDFLERNKPSPQGYSAITPAQREEFSTLMNNIENGNIEDFVKAREHLDQVEKLAEKYGSQSLTAYERELMSVRGQMNEALKKIEPKFKNANEAFEAFKDQKSTLGLNNESRAESLFDNLYGANKTAKQKAAESILTPETMESAKDIAANKTIANAKGPAGSEFGLRNMLRMGAAVPTLGLSIPATSPKVWQHGMRALGNLSQYGKFAPILQRASQESPQALATVMRLLERDPEFQKQMKSLQGDGP